MIDDKIKVFVNAGLKISILTIHNMETLTIEETTELIAKLQKCNEDLKRYMKSE